MKETGNVRKFLRSYVAYYDRQGNPMTLLEWGKKFEDREYQVVAQTKVHNYFVSTIWLGLNHAFGNSRPLIFETMIFNKGEEAFSEFQQRYSTEKEAKAGHVGAVIAVREYLLDLREKALISRQEEGTQTDSQQDMCPLP